MFLINIKRSVTLWKKEKPNQNIYRDLLLKSKDRQDLTVRMADAVSEKCAWSQYVFHKTVFYTL